MLFVRTNTIIILFSVFFNPIMASCDIALEAKEKFSLSPCEDQGNDQVLIKDEDALAKDYCYKLNKHVTLLKEFNELNKKHNIIDFKDISNAIFGAKKIEYKNETIKICISKMIEQKNLEPFFETWAYAYSLCISNKDIDFVREFSIVIFSLYENILTIIITKKFGILNKKSISNKNCQEVNNLQIKSLLKIVSLSEQGVSNDQAIKNLLDDIIKVYNAISELPIKEIINTLEKCYVLFSKILNDYGVGSGLGFKPWIIKYWWLPPTIIIAIISVFLGKKVSKAIGSKLSKFYYLNKDKSYICGKE